MSHGGAAWMGRGCWIACCLAGLALLAGCRSSTPAGGRADASIQQDLLRGVGQIRTTHDRKKLQAELVQILASLRRAHAGTADTRLARKLALQGFEATVAGIGSQLDFIENDSGEVAAATRDAVRADRYLTRGANRLRAAGRALGVQIGDLNGY